MKILFIGDVFGRAGRDAVMALLPGLKKGKKVDFAVVNGENAAGGFGLTPSIAQELFEAGADVLTSGNHIWDNQGVMDIIDSEPRLLRPANYAPGVPGRGWGVFPSPAGKVGVINLSGRVYMKEFDNPFTVVLEIIQEIRKQTPIILVDMHAEITSEKTAMGWHLDGQVSAVLGTHTHIQTADERILPGGTAYLTDAGMTGPYDSVIGVKKEIIIQKFLNQMPAKFIPATEGIKLCGALLDINEQSGHAVSIERIQIPFLKTGQA